jgi:hypothetical protein
MKAKRTKTSQPRTVTVTLRMPEAGWRAARLLAEDRKLAIGGRASVTAAILDLVMRAAANRVVETEGA